MPTIAGMRRRGFAPEALRAFCDLIGVSKANSTIDIGKLEYCVREELNKNATRALGVIDPLEVAVSDGRRIFIERDDWRDEAPDDYKRLAPGRVVRLRHAGFVRGEGLEGGVLKVTALTEDPPEPKKIGVIHWVDAATSVPAEVRLYDRLFGAQKPEEGGVDFIAALSPESLTITKAARLNASFATAEIGSRWQLERVGYFRVDEDSKPGAIVLNRIITLRDEREAVEETAAPAAPKVKNKKAETRPKLKSGPEYRAEARNRDANLASAYAKAISLDVSEEQADLLTGDIASATLFLDVLGAATGDTPASFVAKMLVNDVPPDDRGKLIGVAEGLAYVIGEVHRKAVTPATAKKAIANALERGTDPKTEAETISSAPVGDVGAAVEAAIAANPKQAEAYRAGKTSLIGFFVGQVMRATPNLDAAAVNAAVAERLK